MAKPESLDKTYINYTAMKTEVSRYNNVAVVLHWLTALLIIGMLAGGKYMVSLAESDSLRFTLTQWHKSFGLTILALTLLRIIWRLTHKTPALPATMRTWERGVAHASHALFYLLIVFLPLSGWLLVSASPLNITTYLFDWVRVPHIPIVSNTSDKAEFAERFHQLHFYASTVLIVLLLLHVSAALRHQLVLKDQLMKRMLPDLSDGHFMDGVRLSAGTVFAVTGLFWLLSNATNNEKPTSQAITNTATSQTQNSTDTADQSDSTAWATAEVSYTVVVMGGSLVGDFKGARADAYIDQQNPENSTLRAVVETASSFADSPQIDDALPEADWFDSVNFPKATFESRNISTNSEGEYKVEGELTIRDISKEISFPMDVDLDTMVASGEFSINRLDFSIGANEQSDDSITALDVLVKFRIALR